jgi:hypothetical protein
LIGSRRFSRIENQKKISLDVLETLRELFKTQENLNKVILPELSESQSLPKVNKHCPSLPATYLFTDDEKMLNEEFFPRVPQNIHMGREAEYGFNGAMLKVIVEYDVKGISFRHLLVGGLYYKYIITTEIPTPYKEAPVAVAVSGFFKADSSLWKRKENKRFSHMSLPQEVVDTVEEGVFRSGVVEPIQPGQEISLRVGPNATTLRKGKFLPLPLYLLVQNNVRTLQP